jgi:hypothetical protein
MIIMSGICRYLIESSDDKCQIFCPSPISQILSEDRTETTIGRIFI